MSTPVSEVEDLSDPQRQRVEEVYRLYHPELDHEEGDNPPPYTQASLNVWYGFRIRLPAWVSPTALRARIECARLSEIEKRFIYASTMVEDLAWSAKRGVIPISEYRTDVGVVLGASDPKTEFSVSMGVAPTIPLRLSSRYSPPRCVRLRPTTCPTRVGRGPMLLNLWDNILLRASSTRIKPHDSWFRSNCPVTPKPAEPIKQYFNLGGDRELLIENPPGQGRGTSHQHVPVVACHTSIIVGDHGLPIITVIRRTVHVALFSATSSCDSAAGSTTAVARYNNVQTRLMNELKAFDEIVARNLIMLETHEETELRRRYQQKILDVQIAMGLQSDNETFRKIKAAVAGVTRKLGCMACDATENGKSGFPLKIELAAWWVREEVPITPQPPNSFGANRPPAEHPPRWDQGKRGRLSREEGFCSYDTRLQPHS
ncbi:hypothetical protein BKA70DRAFT_1237723 [Coprinopsis sp. MPI-PUGE-AT-0042]|nr:hypothetical protein BKA70DRAFT_1237723 [Coprinopsis sp. MPI-PUGE-AT-0042]